MSVFSIIRRGRQAAREHSAKQAEKDKKEAERPAYRHVPTHAAVDALSGAPPTWREEDRPRILEQHRRRSAMVANGTARSMPAITTPLHAGTPRANSSLSHVTYPSAYAPSPVVQVPRSYSYNHAAYAATDRTGDGVYTPVEQVGPPSPAVQMPRSYSYNHAAYAANDRAGDGVYAPVEQVGLSFKGKEAVDRPLAVDSGRESRASSKVSSSSSGDSTSSSQDDLEIRPARSGLRRNTDLLWAARATDMAGAGEGELPRPLYPQRRRLSDPPPIMRGAIMSQPRGSYYPPSSSLARPSAYRFAKSSPSFPPVPVPVPPPMRMVPMAPPQPAVVPYTSSMASAAPSAARSLGSGITVAPPAAVYAPPAPTSRAEAATMFADAANSLAEAAASFANAIPDFAPIPLAISQGFVMPGTVASPPPTVPPPTVPHANRSRKSSWGARSTDLVRINSTSSRGPPGTVANEAGRAKVNPTALPTEFDESTLGGSVAAAAIAATAPAKTNKLTKTPSVKDERPVGKTRRFSLGIMGKPAAVAT